MLETTDTLLKGLAEGNENRWARFYRDYAPLIERTLTKHGISYEDAEYPPRPPHDANLTVGAALMLPVNRLRKTAVSAFKTGGRERIAAGDGKPT